ncbi:MAG: LPS translocon maturation chaperone LptM [Gammaproteobacteria bacterium]
MRQLVLAALLALLLAGCGQKGALYLPDQPAGEESDDTELDDIDDEI